MASAQILTNGKALYAYNGTEWVPLNTAGNLVNSTRWQYTAVGSETSLSGNDDNGESLIYTPGYEQVYLNGVLLARDSDYTATTGTTITGLTALTAGYIVEVIAYNNINVGNTYTQAQIDNKVANTFERWTKTVSASGTVISGLDDNAVTLDYTAGLEKVYVNGILLAPEEYVATSGSAVTLDEAVVTNDIIQIHTLKNFRVPNTYTIAQTDDQFLTKTSASSTYLSQSSASTTYAPVAAGGLVQLVPTSIAVTGGSGSVSSTGAVSFTSASSVSIDGVFNTNYNNYRIIFECVTSGTQNITVQFRNGSGNVTASNYLFQNILASSTTLTGGRASGQSSFELLYQAVGAVAISMDVFKPFATDYTRIVSQSGRDLSGTSPSLFTVVGGYNQTTSLTGITFGNSAGNFTGTVGIYGYRN
jgi:hypothetical protein